ncbi:HAD-IIA family hydrolase [Phytoactinopolyspora endophytica]|uniref:HAD-IIA family hydrolase n=1 Tax=Phytoactinopolyspora endophytica TaxID=1642495 RepID=UPI00101D3A3F|nr:HAD-IIA family hydrolase [Phytoactinopolyspora endophytica]
MPAPSAHDVDGRTLAEAYDVALLDLDGVVYIGSTPVEHAAEALKRVRAGGMGLAFVTNNASRPPAAVAAHLTDIGVTAFETEVITSAQAAARLLAEDLPAGAKVLVVGGEGLNVALREQGLTPVGSLDEDPVAVVQGFAPGVDWRALAEAAYAVQRGLPWVASNLDRTIPTACGLAPGNGMLVEAVQVAVGRAPVAAGKPEPPMHREAVLRSGASRPLVVGDRLDTDIEGAFRAGVDSLLVLTGVTGPEELVFAPAEHRPTYVGYDLRSLHERPGALDVAAGQRTCGEWSAAVESNRLVMWHEQSKGGHPDGLDALRAACGAVWSAGPDGLDRQSVVDALSAAQPLNCS